MITGKQEHIAKTEAKMREILKGQPDYMTGFYNSMVNSSRTSSYMTRRNYTYAVIRFMDIVRKPYDQIRYDDIMTFMINDRLKPNGEPKGVSHDITTYSALSRFFKYLMDSERISKNPMQNIERPSSKSNKTMKKVTLTQKEINSIIRKIRKGGGKFALRDELIIALLVTTGMRRTALTEINLSDIDLREKTIQIIDKETKHRTFDLSDHTIDLINRWCEVRKALMRNVSNSDALFISSRYQRITQEGVALIVKKWCGTTEKHITPHKLRATCATLLAESGSDLYEVQHHLGHNSPQTTERYMCVPDKIKKANRLANTFYKI